MNAAPKHVAERSPRERRSDAPRRWLARGAVGLAATAILHPTTLADAKVEPAPPAKVTHHSHKPQPIADGSYRVSACGNYSDRVFLTFDDWPYSNPAQLKKVVRWAANHNVGLGLFPIADFSRAYTKKTGEDLVSFAREHGQYVGNHTASHPDLTKSSIPVIKSEIQHGVQSNLFRPPYGAYDERVKAIAQGLGDSVCTWTEDTEDWTGKSAGDIKNYVVSHSRPGSVVLQHMNHNAFNVETISAEVTGLRQQGLEVCRPWEPAGHIATTPAHLPQQLPC
jgi:peptidoglycan/xylan/chitin deacetylase (PgdA/CDA1 family)